MNEAEEQISDMEDKMMGNNKAEKKRERKLLDHGGGLWELCDSINWNDICIIRVTSDEDL